MGGCCGGQSEGYTDTPQKTDKNGRQVMKYEIDVATTEKEKNTHVLDSHLRERWIFRKKCWTARVLHINVAFDGMPCKHSSGQMEYFTNLEDTGMWRKSLSPKRNLSVGVTGFDVTKKLCLDSSGKIVKYVIHYSPKESSVHQNC